MVVVLASLPGLSCTGGGLEGVVSAITDRKSTRLNSSHLVISYAVFCLKKKKKTDQPIITESSDQARHLLRDSLPRRPSLTLHMPLTHATFRWQSFWPAHTLLPQLPCIA